MLMNTTLSLKMKICYRMLKLLDLQRIFKKIQFKVLINLVIKYRQTVMIQLRTNNHNMTIYFYQRQT